MYQTSTLPSYTKTLLCWPPPPCLGPGKMFWIRAGTRNFARKALLWDIFVGQIWFYGFFFQIYISNWLSKLEHFIKSNKIISFHFVSFRFVSWRLLVLMRHDPVWHLFLNIERHLLLTQTPGGWYIKNICMFFSDIVSLEEYNFYSSLILAFQENNTHPKIKKNNIIDRFDTCMSTYN